MRYTECKHPEHPTEPVFGLPPCPGCGGPGPASEIKEDPAGGHVDAIHGTASRMTTDDVPVEFAEWWGKLVDTDAPMIGRKAKEYGSNSLAAMGRLYARGQGREVDSAEALELGCYVYAYGKMQRVADAMIRGKLPSVDTLKDTMIYMAMAQYIRANGRWP